MILISLFILTYFFYCLVCSMIQIHQMIIEVQHCIDCHLHNWCSRHNEAKYHDFYNKIQAKVSSLFQKAQITKNEIPDHYQPKNASSSIAQGVHHYFNTQKNEDVIFPRHGAFEIKVNGILIFSKLQSNVWPNLEKIISLLTQIQTELQYGKSIQKFSLDYKPESFKEEEKIVETYKKVIKFKINKRPHSGQFNANNPYLPKGSLENSPESKLTQLKRKNRQSVKKGKLQRKSDVCKKPLIRFKNDKAGTISNFYNQAQQPKENDDCQLPQIGKIVKNEFASPASKKKLQFKNQQIFPMKAQPFEILANANAPALKLDKKSSKKLVIKASDKKGETFPQPNRITNQNIDDPCDASDKVFISQNPVFFTNYQTKKSLKSVMSIGDRLQSGKDVNAIQNEICLIKVEDYTEKKIKSPKNEQKEKSCNHLESTKNKKSNLAYQDDYQNQNNAQIRKEAEHAHRTSSHKQPAFHPEEKVTVGQVSSSQHIIYESYQIQNPKVEKLEQEYEEQLYDEYQFEEKEQVRPETSSSRRMKKDQQLNEQQEILQCQEIIEGNFKKKEQILLQNTKQQIKQENFPSQKVQNVPTPNIHNEQKAQSVKSKQDIEIAQPRSIERVASIQKEEEQIDEIEEEKGYQTIKQLNKQDKKVHQDHKVESSNPQQSQTHQETQISPSKDHLQAKCITQQQQNSRKIEGSAEQQHKLSPTKEAFSSEIKSSSAEILPQNKGNLSSSRQSQIQHQSIKDLDKNYIIQKQKPQNCIEAKQLQAQNEQQMPSIQLQQQQKQQQKKETIQEESVQKVISCVAEKENTIQQSKNHQKEDIPQQKQKEILQNNSGGPQSEKELMKVQDKPVQEREQIKDFKETQIAKQLGKLQPVITKEDKIESQKLINSCKAQEFISNNEQKSMKQGILIQQKQGIDKNDLEESNPLPEEIEQKIEERYQSKEKNQQNLPNHQEQQLVGQIEKLPHQQQHLKSQQIIQQKQVQKIPQQQPLKENAQQKNLENERKQSVDEANKKQESKRSIDQRVQRQVQLPSIHHMSQLQNKDTSTIRSIPNNGTESSIGLTSQVHSELNNVYYEIQARFDTKEDEDV